MSYWNDIVWQYKEEANLSNTSMFKQKYPLHDACWRFAWRALDLEINEANKILKEYFVNMNRSQRLGMVLESLEMQKERQPSYSDKSHLNLITRIVRSELFNLENPDND